MSYISHTKDLYTKIDKENFPYLSSKDEKPFSYVPSSNLLLRCDTVLIKGTGEEFPISSDFKVVYTYMRERYAYSKFHKQPYYESWDLIATIIGKTSEVFKKKNDRKLPIHRLMEKIGLLVILPSKTGRSNHKVVKDVSEILPEVSFLNSKNKDYKERKLSEREAYLAKKKLTVEEVKIVVEEPRPKETSFQDYTYTPDVDPWELDEDMIPF